LQSNIKNYIFIKSVYYVRGHLYTMSVTYTPPKGGSDLDLPPLGGMGGKRTKGLRAKGQKGDLGGKKNR
jgi:hypothetical protein